jgi:hypothetical protein
MRSYRMRDKLSPEANLSFIRVAGVGLKALNQACFRAVRDATDEELSGPEILSLVVSSKLKEN